MCWHASAMSLLSWAEVGRQSGCSSEMSSLDPRPSTNTHLDDGAVLSKERNYTMTTRRII